MKKIYLFLTLGLIVNAYRPVEAHSIPFLKQKLTHNERNVLIAAGCCATIVSIAVLIEWLSSPTTETYETSATDDSIYDTEDDLEEERLEVSPTYYPPMPKPKVSEYPQDKETCTKDESTQTQETKNVEEVKECDNVASADADDALIEQIRETELLETNF